MIRVEIRAKFDEIVAFSEVEQFLDTPVKRYSSGMYVRLAFAVAAHLVTEILLVDEVLVGQRWSPLWLGVVLGLAAAATLPSCSAARRWRRYRRAPRPAS